MNGTVKDQPHDLVFFLGKVFRGFWLVRGPFFVALIAALLEYSPPFKELLRIFAEDKFTFLKSQIILGVVSLAIFTGLLWRMSRELFLVSDFLAIYNFRIAKWVRCVIPALVAALPLLGLAVAARSQYAELSELQVVQIEPASATIEPHRAAAETVSSEAIAEASQRAKADFEPSEQAKEAYAREKRAFRPSWAAEIKDLVAPEEGKLSPAENATFDELSRALEETKKSQIAFMYLSLICFAGAALIVIASLAYDFLSGSAHNAQPSEALPWSLRLNWVWLLSMLFCIGLFGFQGAENLHAIDPTRFARWFGTPAIVFLFFTFLVLVVSLATRVFDEHYIPIISLVVLCGLVSAYLERSSNHTIRELERAPPAQPPLYAAFR